MGLDRYRLLVQLGAGPDGVAYRAVAEDGMMVEIRDLSGAQAVAARWPRIAHRLRLVAQLVHPTVFRVRELGLDQGPPFVAIEWVEGLHLTEALRESLPLPEADVLAMARPLAEVLAETHRLGLAHGRIEPSRVILDAEQRPRIDLTGVEVRADAVTETAAQVDETHRTAKAVGERTPVSDREEDVGDLGTLIGWLLTGHRLRTGNDLLEAGIDTASPIGRLLADMLAPNPADRPSARDVAERLDALSDSEDAGRTRDDVGGSTMPGLASALPGTIDAPMVPRETVRPP
jgi:serine/threonine protein kinase